VGLRRCSPSVCSKNTPAGCYVHIRSRKLLSHDPACREMHRVRIRIGSSGKEMLWGVDVPHVKKYVTTGNKNETKKAQKKNDKKNDK